MDNRTAVALCYQESKSRAKEKTGGDLAMIGENPKTPPLLGTRNDQAVLYGVLLNRRRSGFHLVFALSRNESKEVDNGKATNNFSLDTDSCYRVRRWVVERTHSWLNRSCRILVRWEKKAENYLAFLHLACAQLLFTKLAVFG